MIGFRGFEIFSFLICKFEIHLIIRQQVFSIRVNIFSDINNVNEIKTFANLNKLNLLNRYLAMFYSNCHCYLSAIQSGYLDFLKKAFEQFWSVLYSSISISTNTIRIIKIMLCVLFSYLTFNKVSILF